VTGRDPGRVRDAFQQFEALRIGQMLRTERESGKGWQGSGEDPIRRLRYGEPQFAAVFAKHGGLGLAADCQGARIRPVRRPDR